MAWQDQYRSASFRGIPFYTESDDNGPFGRRLAVHQFPFRNNPKIQDLGRNDRPFTIEGYLLGDDYINDTKKLVTACEKEGPGELVHPTLGSIRVECLGVRVVNRTRQRRISFVTMSFIESTEEDGLFQTVDSKSLVVASKLNAFEKLREFFNNIFDVVNVPYFYATSALNTLNQFADTVGQNRKIVNSIAGFVQTSKGLKDRVLFFLFSTEDLFNTLEELISIGTSEDDDLLPASENNSYDQFRELNRFFTFTPNTTIDNTDPSFILSNTIQAMSLINMGGLLPLIPMSSVSEAETLRDIVLNKIDDLAPEMGDDVFDALYQLRESIIINLNDRSLTLARSSELTLNETSPALILSYDLYGNVDREEDLTLRNDILHPGFMPGGIPLEVLIDAE